MFPKLSLLLVVPLVKALTLDTPTGLTSGGTATINWVNAAGDPSTFSLELVNDAFHNAFAIANNVNPASGTITIELPIVPESNAYTIEAVNISNITEVFAVTNNFAIAGVISVSSTSTTSASTSSTKPATSLTKPLTTATTSGFGTTTTPTTPATTASVTLTSASSSSSSASTSTQSSAAAPLKFGSAASGAGAIAVALMTIVGGAAALVL